MKVSIRHLQIAVYPDRLNPSAMNIEEIREYCIGL